MKINIKNLQNIAKKIRLSVLDTTIKKNKGHIGGTYSCVDILVALYYGNILKINSKNFRYKNRNRFILSKGHACLALYSILNDLKILPTKKLETYGDNGGLGAQLDMSVPGVDWVTGSLGHAVGVSSGFAYSAKLDKLNFKSFVLLGDAECEEGSIWESFTFAANKKLNNLVVIIDRNRLSVTDVLDDNSFFKNYDKILISLGWNYYDIDGHSYSDLLRVLNLSLKSNKPTLILCNTIKGKGVSFMENSIKFHHALPSADQVTQAVEELK